jgi:REP element-mobilizing transposase RayT
MYLRYLKCIIIEKFKNKYRIGSKRLQYWDYSWNGYYYITICSKNRECYFGEIQDDKMILNEIGKIAQKYWIEIPIHFNNAKLDEFVIMPNHIHGIIIIDNDTII